jgi:hypothetical protein
MGVDVADNDDMSATSLYFYGIHYMLHGKSIDVDDVLNDILSNNKLSENQIKSVRIILQGLKESQ